MSTTSKPDGKTEKKRKQWPRVRKIEGRNLPWLVDGRVNGKGERFFFATVTEADTKADQLRIDRLNTGNEGASVSTKLRVDAVEASKRLSPVGATLNEAVEYYLANAKPEGGQRTVRDVVTDFITAKRNAGRKSSYLDIQNYVLGNVFGRDFGDRWINEITAPEIDVWLNAKPWTMRTRVNYFADVRNLFGFAIRKGFRATNPMAALEKPEADKKKPGILTPEEAAALLVACDGQTPDMLPAVAIALFAGARTSELKNMQWKHVDFEDGQIEIPEEEKTGARYIPMSDNLRAWLLPYAKRTGPVYPGKFKCFGYYLNERRILAHIENWPKNAMRHSFGSYHYAQHNNADLTAAQLGHINDRRTLFKHYRALAKPKAAAAYWSIVPSEEAGEKVTPMPAAA